MKRFLAVLLCILMCGFVSPMALAVNSRDISLETSLASHLKELGLLQGVSENDDGTADFDLSRKPNRAEALIMLIRTLGKGDEAKACPKTHPFTDVPVWADGYVSYAYQNGLTKGMSETLFGVESTASAEMYLTFMLRALGYSEGDDREFTWNRPWELAAWCGILPVRVDKTEFLRADVVDVTCAALYASMKGTQTTLQERLVSQGSFTKKQFETAFPKDPFADFRQLDSKVSAAIATKKTLGLSDDNVYTLEVHIIVDTQENNGVLSVTAIVFTGGADIKKGNTLGSYGGGTGPWLIKLDAKTLECQSCQTTHELANQGLYWTDWLPKKALIMPDSLMMGGAEVCKLETQMKLDSGVIAYKQPTYEKALADTVAYFSRVTQPLETDSCTILLGWLDGTRHGSSAHLRLIYKANSAVGEGEIVSLPMPWEGYWGHTSQPLDLRLSKDGMTLYYSYHYDDRLAYPQMGEDVEKEVVRHEAGTYSYTVDLNTGKTSLELFPD